MKKLEWNIKSMKVSELKEFGGVLRDYSLLDLAKMKATISKDGVLEPLVINTDGTILNGHLRYKALLDLKIKEVVVSYPSKKLTKSEEVDVYLRMNENIVGINDFKALRENYTEDYLVDGGFSVEVAKDIHLDPEQDIDISPKIFTYKLIFNTKEDKEVASKLLNKLKGTLENTEVEDAIITIARKELLK